MIYLKDYILTEKIRFLESANKDEVLDILVDSVRSFQAIKDFEAFKRAVKERESILSTGIGNNVAIPHVKMSEIDEFFIIIGVHKKGINWESIDENLVNLIFFIGGPDNHNLYLRILSKLFLIIKNKNIRDKILTCNTKEEVAKIFEKF